MLPPKKLLKMLSEELKLCSQPYKDVLGKETQISTLNQLKKKN